MSDTASHGAPQHDSGELRHTLSIHDVGVALTDAGVPRSHRQIIRYCETGMLEAVKVPGPTGAQWYVSPASIPKVVGDLKQWEAQRARHGAPRPAATSYVEVEKVSVIAEDMASHSAPRPAMSELQQSHDITETQPDTARHSETQRDMPPEITPVVPSPTEIDQPRQSTINDIFEHPYVKKLEDRVEKLEAKYEAQVRRTEEIQLRAQDKLVELQRMTTIGQSKTLADFMLQAKNWMVGDNDEQPKMSDQQSVDNH